MVSFKTDDDLQLEKLKLTLADTPHVGKLIELTKTLDQARAVLTFLEACADRDKKANGSKSNVLASGKSTTVSLTAPRGRGKSAALGLCLAGAISFGFNSIVVTAPGKHAFPFRIMDDVPISIPPSSHSSIRTLKNPKIWSLSLIS